MSQTLPRTDPSLVTLPDVTVAVVHTSGDPSEFGPRVMKALYGAAYKLKFDLKKRGVHMKMEMPRARWDWSPGRPEQAFLEGAWALPVPEETEAADLVSNEPDIEIGVERWTYGECAWILHVGGYDEEEPTVARLAAFIEENGREIAGMHEEWYMSGPAVKEPKTVILYPVRPRA